MNKAALLALALLSGHPTILHVRTYYDLIAAEECRHGGYPYMLRIGPHDVLCLETITQGEHQAVKVSSVIAAAGAAVKRLKRY
jgi:hypothetical protein